MLPSRVVHDLPRFAKESTVARGAHVPIVDSERMLLVLDEGAPIARCDGVEQLFDLCECAGRLRR